MCEPITIGLMLAASTAVTVAGQLKQGDDAAKAAELQGAYATDNAVVQARNIRKAATYQKGAANAALAASGTNIAEGTALEVKNNITVNSEQDALSAILDGRRSVTAAEMQGRTARENAMYAAAGTVLQSGYAASRHNWRGAKPSTGATS